MKNRNWLLLAFALLWMGMLADSGVSLGQDVPPPPPPPTRMLTQMQKKPLAVYRLDFVVRELENGKELNSRTYRMSVEAGITGRIRVGSRVPIPTGEKNYNYQDVGINIDCTPREEEGGLLLHTNFDSSSVVQQTTIRSITSGPDHATEFAAAPIFRQARFNGDSLVTIGKASIIAKLDDVATNRRYEVEVTATKVK